jgi:hypothetical protein
VCGGAVAVIDAIIDCNIDCYIDFIIQERPKEIEQED